MNYHFIGGVIVGIVFKNKIINVLTKVVLKINTKKTNKVQANPTGASIYFVAKVTDREGYHLFFPNGSQPMWDYYPGKDVIKFKIDKYQVNNKTSFTYLTKELDLPMIKTFADIYIYTEYNGIIRIYRESESIKEADFDSNTTNKVICCKGSINGNGKSFYITNYINKFNGADNVTPELLLINYDLFDQPIESIKLNIIKKENINEYSFKQIINLN